MDLQTKSINVGPNESPDIQQWRRRIVQLGRYYILHYMVTPQDANMDLQTKSINVGPNERTQHSTMKKEYCATMIDITFFTT